MWVSSLPYPSLEYRFGLLPNVQICNPRFFHKDQVALSAAGTFKPGNIRHLFVELEVDYDLAYFFTDIYSIFQGGENLESIELHVSPESSGGSVQHTVAQNEPWALMLSGPLVAYRKSLPKLVVVDVNASYGELLLKHVQPRLKGKLTGQKRADIRFMVLSCYSYIRFIFKLFLIPRQSSALRGVVDVFADRQ
ncbi:hypothetical protein UCREL1_11121 [Eutypa lata UCREL1]|uniref:Uncharacterized protein n=1 Tax=Eutypa lata (strain UCR-EL1) TaxID=1287681 RepID=M7SCL8_EUTLA|nr:hypothetical protein UCREL1_11121 [Eutypa lata UCREL1]